MVTREQNHELGGDVMRGPLSSIQRWRCFLIVLISAFFGSSKLGAQSYPGQANDVDASVASTSLIIAQLRPLLFNDLPDEELGIYKTIHFEVSPDSHHSSAFASKKNSVRYVTMTEGMGRTIELSSDALIIEWFYNKPGFTSQYMKSVLSLAVENDKRAKQGQTPVHIPAPVDFAGWSRADKDKFGTDAEIHSSEMKLWEGAFSFVLAHEVAHHILGHEDSEADSPADQRQRETDADAWAIDLLVRKGVSPVAGIIPMLFSYELGLTPLQETGDHPADARRLLAMYEGLSERLPTFKASIQASGQDYETVRAQVAQGLTLVRQEIDTTRAGKSQ
jgi:IrrE N-terminal-like domain